MTLGNRLTRLAAASGATAVATAALVGFAGVPAQAHGTFAGPVSRVYSCYLENPEAPKSAACKAAVAVSGTQAFYDWTEVNIANAAGNHQALIPDGKLCSAGRAKYAGLDLARSDWTATKLPTSGSFTFSFKATAQHKGRFDLYVTNSTYRPTQPLRWSNLEATPFLSVTDPVAVNGAYQLTGRLPAGKTGRHLVYGIWQRSDSPEAFYACSDVVFGSESSSGGGTVVTPTTPTTPAATASAAPSNSASPSASASSSPGGCGTSSGHHHHRRTDPSATAVRKASSNSTLAPALTGSLGTAFLFAMGTAALFVGRRYIGKHRH
ncbi:lytic polysaccharide monooxygenase [Cryptosporangium minutisporangium]|uniref:Chitin-binding type-4 domain-containing protein n=1 Tax=Cryptosporangium minutisporangium TaxID=113569 RepID=A0ABP6SQN4_9ACTN